MLAFMPLNPAPKFEKHTHHVVPAAWQKRFTSAGDAGPYYRNVITQENLNAQGPGNKMSEEYAYIVFDEYFRPSDRLEDRLSTLEAKAIQGLDRTIATSVIDALARVDIAYLLAIQACRYPDQFRDRLNLGRYLAIALKHYSSCPDAATLNKALRSTGMLPGAAITATEFERLKAASEENLANELEQILDAHGYEAYFNPELIIEAAYPVAMHLLGLEWHLIESVAPAFILSDRPVPMRINYGFGIGLSARLGLRLSKPTTVLDDLPINAVKASRAEIDAINQEVRGRARQWICGPGAFVHNL
ncbi:MAG: DUF4238 domain-containing protein [Hyphomicrobiales bacterium]|nr:MAG: DUF4238 domain-containing protein [Hyphomicrobiales bacterium]